MYIGCTSQSVSTRLHQYYTIYGTLYLCAGGGAHLPYSTSLHNHVHFLLTPLVVRLHVGNTITEKRRMSPQTYRAVRLGVGGGAAGLFSSVGPTPTERLFLPVESSDLYLREKNIITHTSGALLMVLACHTCVCFRPHTLREDCLHTYVPFPLWGDGLPPPGRWRGPLAVKQGRTFNNMVHSPLALFNTHAYRGNTCSHKPTQYWRWPVQGVGSLLVFSFSLTPPPWEGTSPPVAGFEMPLVYIGREEGKKTCK